MSIETVNGKVSIEELGMTYIHEHLRIDLSKEKKDTDTNFDDIGAVIEEMRTLKSKGVETIVEVTNIGMGRDIDVLKTIALQSGIKVIASTGFYKEPYLPEYVYDMNEKELSKILVDEITSGIEGTGVKAHMIGEIGSSQGTLKPAEGKVFRAAVRAHLETGNPISTHTTLGTAALEQLSLFKEYKLNPSKVVIGHLDLKCDLDYHLRVADTGCFMAFDTIGKTNYETDEKRAYHIKELIDRGHIGQIVLSQDITRKSHLTINGGIGYGHLIDNFIPLLIKIGLGEHHIKQMIISNPRRLLGI